MSSKSRSAWVWKIDIFEKKARTKENLKGRVLWSRQFDKSRRDHIPSSNPRSILPVLPSSILRGGPSCPKSSWPSEVMHLLLRHLYCSTFSDLRKHKIPDSWCCAYSNISSVKAVRIFSSFPFSFFHTLFYLSFFPHSFIRLFFLLLHFPFLWL